MQQKLAVIALRLAQAQHFSEGTGRRCLFAIDDIPAELDRIHRERVMSVLANLGGQVFVTTTDPALLEGAALSTSAMFHVEHGAIRG